MKTRYRSLGLMTFCLGLVACGSSSSNNPDTTPTPPAAETVVDVAVADGNFTTLVAALEATGLDETLDDPEGRFTVFAPTDDAFALLGDDAISALLADPDTLSDILLYHVVAGAELDAATAVAAAGTTLEMANGDSVGLSLSGDSLLINLSTVTVTDVQADNGVIHVIDTVLSPPTQKGDPQDNIVETAINNGNFTTLVTALEAAGLDSVLANEEEIFTVFAPTDAAFEKLGETAVNDLIADVPALTDVLLQHVIVGAEVNSISAFALNGTAVDTESGEDVTVEIVNGALEIQGSTITMFDLYTSNGVIHVIDTVITETLE